MKKPKHLNEKAHAKYEELHKIVVGKLKDGDENLLAVLANTYVSYDIANECLMGRPPTAATEAMTRKNPAHDMVKDDIKIISELSSHFGLSPKARGDNMNGPDKTEDKLDELLKDD